MNIFKLKELTSDYVIYFYQPEGRGAYGEIRMNMKDDEATIDLRSEEVSSWHDRHALTAIEKCVEKQKFPSTFTQAWY